MLFSQIPRTSLLTEPTLLEKAAHFGDTIGHSSLWIKREDVMGLGMGGNKVRSLEFWLGEALEKSCDIVLAAGLPPSNLCRLTAAACCRLNLDCEIIHNAAPSNTNPRRGDSRFLYDLMGVRQIYCGPVDEQARKAFVEERAQELKEQGRNPYILGDPVVGALGYVAAAQELLFQAEQKHIDLRHVFISASAGPTEIGLLFGLRLMGGPDLHVHLVSVEYPAHTFWPIAQEIWQGLCQKLHVTPPLSLQYNTHFYEEYLGPGYAKHSPETWLALRLLARTEGIFLDTTYNAKVFAGLTDLCQKGRLPTDEAVVIFHTGGVPTLLMREE